MLDSYFLTVDFLSWYLQFGSIYLYNYFNEVTLVDWSAHIDTKYFRLNVSIFYLLHIILYFF